VYLERPVPIILSDDIKSINVARFTDAGGGLLDAGGGFLDAGGGFLDAGGGFLDAGGGFLDAGGGFLDAGGGFLDAGGGGLVFLFVARFCFFVRRVVWYHT
jgi:hypothetical protein